MNTDIDPGTPVSPNGTTANNAYAEILKQLSQIGMGTIALCMLGWFIWSLDSKHETFLKGIIELEEESLEQQKAFVELQGIQRRNTLKIDEIIKLQGQMVEQRKRFADLTERIAIAHEQLVEIMRQQQIILSRPTGGND